MAAATTSLPETPGGERNWDYRYTWIRDSTFMLWGLYTLGFDWEANDFFYFIADVAEQSTRTSRSCTGSTARASSPRRRSTTCPATRARGRCGSGNGAYNQEQHDVWGALLDSIYLHTKSRDHLPERIWPIVKRQVEAALENWREPDRGIWEIRGEPKHFTSSKLMCWVAADRGARLAEIRERARARGALAVGRRRDQGGHLRERRRRARRVHPALRHRRAGRLGAADACSTRFLPADDERIGETVLAIADELTEDGHGPALPRRTRPTTASPARRAPSRSARSGSCRRSSRSARSGAPATCATSCSPTRARSACTPRRSTRARAATWATSRRRSPTWP